MDDAVCVINIGPTQRRRRRNLGMVSLAIGVAVAAAVWAALFPRSAVLASALFFYGGFAGIFQARAKTWMRLASRGLRDLDGGPERIEDGAELAAVRAQARRVFVQSAVSTAVLTAVVWVLAGT